MDVGAETLALRAQARGEGKGAVPRGQARSGRTVEAGRGVCVGIRTDGMKRETNASRGETRENMGRGAREGPVGARAGAVAPPGTSGWCAGRVPRTRW